LPEPGGEFGGRWVGEAGFFSGRGLVHERPIFGHDAIEFVYVLEGLKQIVQFAPGDHQEPPPGSTQPVQRFEGGLIDSAVMGERAVIIGCKS
jgi:hypothetical protein